MIWGDVMSNIVEIEHLHFGYQEKEGFHDFNLSIEEGKWITLVGPNGSGKSTLVRIMAGLIDVNTPIRIDGMLVNKENINDIRKKIQVVFENPSCQLIGETVASDIAFALENLQYDRNTIRKKIDVIAHKLGIENLLDMPTEKLSNGQKAQVILASSLVIEPKILVLDEAFSSLDYESKARILTVLRELHKESQMTIIEVTHYLEDALESDEVIALASFEIVLRGAKELVFREEKLFHKIGLELPFMASLSLKLEHYGLIQGLHFNMEALVDELWK